MATPSVLAAHPPDAALSDWQSEALLQKVVQVVPSIIYIFNQQTQSNEYSNRSLGEFIGYSAAEVQRMGAAMLPNLCHPDDLSRIADHFSGIRDLADGEVRQIEYRVKHKNGRWVWLLSHDTVFDRTPEGEVLRHIGTASNITAQKTAEELARAAHLRASAINDELRSFSYAMSHDMKSPSNTLTLLLTEMLDTHGEAFDDDARDLCMLALTTAGRMGRLVDDVLNYTRVVDQELEVGQVDLNAVLSDALSHLAPILRRTEADVTCANLPVVKGDAAQLLIYFTNMIDNALQFHKPGYAPEITIGAAFENEEDSTDCTVFIRDEGIGIDPSKHNEIFKVFRRENRGTTDSGTGLGLAICRRIAVNHGSRVTLESGIGEGAKFSMRLQSE